MITVKFEVTQTQVTVIEKSDRLTSGNEQQIRCVFNLSEEYSNLIVRAVFNGEYRTLVDGECFAPELDEGRCVIGVYGYSEENGKIVKRISPVPCEEYVYEGSYSDKNKEVDDTSPSELEEYYSSIKKLIDSGLLKGDKGDKGDKGEDAQLPENLRRTVVVYSDEEAEQRLAEIAENFSALTPIEIIFAYDALDSQGFPSGSSVLIIDSGTGSLDDAILVPFISCETVFTSEQAQQLSECNSFVSAYYDNTDWMDIVDRSGQIFELSLYSDGKTFVERKTRQIIFDLIFNGLWCEITIGGSKLRLQRDEFEAYADEAGNISLMVDIQPGVNYWLVNITAGDYRKFVKKTSKSTDKIGVIKFTTSIAYDITVTNAYGRSI